MSILEGINAAGGVTNRVMPGNLQWRALFNSAGRLTEEKNIGTDGSTTRLTSYSYYSAGSPYAGLLQTRTDGRSVTCTYGYDEWLRPATNTHAGSLAEHNLTTAWQYDPRGLVTDITENFASTNTGPGTMIRRSFTAYGQASGENVYLGGQWLMGASQKWDSAGRRTGLGFGSAGYNYTWRADGLLASTAAGYGSAIAAGSYTYTDAGLLLSRIVGSRVTEVTARDRVGRPLAISTTITNSPKLTETLAWRPDGLLATHTLEREDYTDDRSFAYASGSRRLVEERLGLNAFKGWTNSFVYDGGTAGGPGVMTRAGSPSSSSAQWSGGRDAFLRIAAETNTVTRRQAQGRVNGSNGYAVVRVNLDSKPQAVTTVATGNSNWPTQWRATLELTPGAHQLNAQAVHPSGLFTTNATIWFTNTAAYDTLADSFDGGGYQTNRVWKQGANIVRSQALRWDAKGRLFQVIDRFIDRTNGVALSTNGVNFTATYDAFDRLLRTVETPVVASVTNTAARLTIDHYYDPEHEFLELGVSENGRVTWKVMGPDLDGTFGGQNGTGGFEAIVPGPELFCPIIADAFGNLHAIFDPKHASLTWYQSRVAGYGAVPGYSPVPLGQVGPDLGAKYVYRNRALSSVGFVYMGRNWYDPSSGQFLSPDPAGHEGSASLYSFCHGNPWGFWDADGRLGKEWKPLNGAAENAYNGRMSFAMRLAMISGTPYEPPQQASFAERARHFTANTVFNASEVQEAWHEVSNPDFSNGWGMASFGVGMISLGANTADAVANLIPGKAALQTTVKTGIKEMVKIGAKEAAEVAAKEVGKTSFKSFDALKRELGPAGEGQVWHHIVEQRAVNVERFGAEAIHNTENAVRASREINQKIANYYSSKDFFTSGQTVRQWLTHQSLEAQREFGLKVMQRLGASHP